MLSDALFLNIPENGNKSSDSRKEGSVASFTCNHGYELHGSVDRTCQGDGTWTGSSVSCVMKVDGGKSDSSAYVLAVSLSVSSGVVIIVIVVFVMFFCRRRRQKKQQEEVIELPTISNIPVFENQTFMHSLQNLSKDGRFKIPRPNFVHPRIFQEYF